MESLIAAEQVFELAAVLLSLTALGFWVETTSIGRKLTGVLVILVLGMLLANIRVIPHGAPIYGTINAVLVPLAIPMLLFRANMREVLREIGPMFKAFCASVMVITVAIVAVALAFDFGEFEAQVAGVLSASYIGGSMNFVSTAQAVEFNDPTHYAGALAADAIGAVLFLSLLLMMPSLAIVRRAMPSRYMNAQGESLRVDAPQLQAGDSPPFNLIGLATAIAVSMVVCAVANLVTAALGIENLFILVLTLLALGVANFLKPLVKRFNSEFEVGTFFMYLFFVVVGAGVDITLIAGVAWPYVLLIVSAVMLFFGLILVVGKLLKLDLAELMIAANACVLGPPTAAALAAAKGWKDLITAGMLCGVLGYALATFIGVGVTKLLT